MKKTSLFLLTLLLTSLLLCTSQNTVITTAAPDQTVSGYVLDSNGNGIANVKVNFFFSSPPSIICYTNDSGYYSLKPYSGKNIVTITPPSNTNYVKYIENSFNVQANITANFTLTLGYRLSGLVIDQNWQPIKSGSYSDGGVGIYLDEYFSGTWADSKGAYYVVAPAGNYTVHARACQAGSWGGVGYSKEYMVLSNQIITLNSDTTANVVVNMPDVTPTPTTEITPTTTAEFPRPTPTTTGLTSQPTATPTVPEAPAWIIITLGLLLSAMACCFMVKKRPQN